MKGKSIDYDFSQEKLREVLDYNPATGVFVWKISPARNVRAGSVAGGSAGKAGYRYVKVFGIEVTTSRLAWFYMTGEWPERRVRFKNGDRSDARFENLTLFNGIGGEYDFKSRDGRAQYLRAYRKAVPHLEKGRALRGSFGLSLEDYQRMHDAQGGRCAICDSPENETRNGKVKMLAVDHCHETGKIRGLLCCPCNQAIGKLRDNSAIMRRAADYIDRHRKP